MPRRPAERCPDGLHQKPIGRRRPPRRSPRRLSSRRAAPGRPPPARRCRGWHASAPGAERPEPNARSRTRVIGQERPRFVWRAVRTATGTPQFPCFLGLLHLPSSHRAAADFRIRRLAADRAARIGRHARRPELELVRVAPLLVPLVTHLRQAQAAVPRVRQSGKCGQDCAESASAGSSLAPADSVPTEEPRVASRRPSGSGPMASPVTDPAIAP